MDPYVRPGPARLRAGLMPGGVIIHVYSLDGRLVGLSVLDPNASDAAIEAEGSRAAAAFDGDVCLVGYDGDDGHRFTPEEWAREVWFG